MSLCHDILRISRLSLTVLDIVFYFKINLKLILSFYKIYFTDNRNNFINIVYGFSIEIYAKH